MKPVMTEFRTATVGALIVALGSISMSLYTPALPTLAAAFETTPSAVKLTLTSYMLGYAGAMLFCGTLSDAFGRRPAAIGFLLIYLVGSLIALVASTIGGLAAARLLQGIGAAAGVTISRAIVRDQYAGQTSMRIMSLIGLMFAVGPAVAPTIGGLILASLGWQAIFAAMAAYGLVALLVVLFACAETNMLSRRASVRPMAILRNYHLILSSRAFLHGGLLLGLTVGGVYTLAVILPFVLIDTVRLTPTQFGMAMIMQTGAYAAGMSLMSQLLKTISGDRMLRVGLVLVTMGGLCLAILPFLMPPSLLTVMLPVAVWAFGCALIIPAATTGALGAFGEIAGSASAMVGFFQIGGGLLGSAVSALFFVDAPTALAWVLPMMAALALLSHFMLGRANPL